MRVLIIISYKWAFYWAMQGIKEHSKHSIDFASYTGVDFDEAKKYDAVYCLNNLCWERMAKRWGGGLARRLTETNKVILGVGSRKNANSALKTINQVKFRHIRTPSTEIKNHLQSKTHLQNIMVVRHGVDPDIFRPLKRRQRGFVVGWAGNYPRKEKRTHLLSRLGHPLKIAKDVDHSEMVFFYNSVYVYVCISSTEGTPMTVPEAMACGLPVVSTEVGLVPELLEDEWIVPVNPEERVVALIKRKLDALCMDETLRRRVGDRNRREILDKWTCKIRAVGWDKLFEA